MIQGGAGSLVRPEQGTTLIETMISVFVLSFGLMALAQVLAVVLVINKNHGSDATRSTAYAHDKMEELSGLTFANTTTNLTVDPPFPTNGAGLTAGGSIYPAATQASYSDYVDRGGIRTSASNAAFTRQWQVVDETASLKRVVVSVRSNKSFAYGTPPATFLVTYKSQ